MKTKKVLYYVLMFLPLLAAIIALAFLPEKIPAHYDINGQVTRWGSKFEILLFPVITILFGLFMLGMAKISAKMEKSGKNNEQIVIVGGLCSLVLFNVLTGYFLYTDFNQVKDLGSVIIDPTQLIFGILGVIMVIVGNIMPKAKLNSIVGLRTPWSMKNETTWKKSQRFGGISFIVTGVIIVIISFITKPFVCLIGSLIILLLAALAGVLYSYKIARKN